MTSLQPINTTRLATSHGVYMCSGRYEAIVLYCVYPPVFPCSLYSSYKTYQKIHHAQISHCH